TLKLFFMFFLFAMAKAIVPRYRYDQLMRLGWKVFLPLSLAMVVIVAGVLQFAGLGPKWGRHGGQQQPNSRLASAVGIRIGVLPRHALLLQAEADAELSLREGSAVAALPRRACAAPLSQRRRALHRLQALRGHLPGTGDHDRGRPAPQRRH